MPALPVKILQYLMAGICSMVAASGAWLVEVQVGSVVVCLLKAKDHICVWLLWTCEVEQHCETLMK